MIPPLQPTPGSSGGPLGGLLRSSLGAPRADRLLSAVHLPEQAISSTGRVTRSQLAMALGLILFDDVCRRVPMAAAYVGDLRRSGRALTLDHGALRTVSVHPNSKLLIRGELPVGRAAIARILEPLGYAEADHYPLDRLGMTGIVYTHRDAPEELPQYFVSELHPDRFSPEFQAAVDRVLASSRDPLDRASLNRLEVLRRRGSLEIGDAERLLPRLSGSFDRHHEEPRLADYNALLAESPEMAWIATEGHAFNHATDRVLDVSAVAEEQRRLGRPIKEAVEVSSSGRIRQTAFRAAQVERLFRTDDDILVPLHVPGSFHEFIQREALPDGRLDLKFDAGNAQGIFKMTDARSNPSATRSGEEES